MMRWSSVIFITVLGSSALNAAQACSTNAGTINQKAAAHQAIIQKYAEKYDVSTDMVKAVIAVESCYNSGAVSPKGAQGLMQLIPTTAERFGVEDAFDTTQNIHGGTRYLSWLMKRYNGDLYKAIAAYNAGEGAVDKYQGIPPYAETQQYVRKVLAAYNGLSGQAIALPAVTVGTSKAASSDSDAQAEPIKPVQLPPSKPGRGGWEITKAKAPHLFKQ